MNLYRIANWATLYENNRTRELKALSWVPFPNSHDGDGYTALMGQKNAEALLGAFTVIVQVASKCDPRGTLLRDGARPHTAASLARMTRFSEATIARCLEVCSDPEIGWLLCEKANESDNPAPWCDDPAGSCDNPAGGCLEGKGKKEGNRREATTAPATDSDWRKELQNSDAYKVLNVESEFQKMVFWCQQKKKVPSRARFLNWLNRCDRPVASAESNHLTHDKNGNPYPDTNYRRPSDRDFSPRESAHPI